MNSNKEIGSFFELSLTAQYEEYHSEAIKLNSARNCLKYILQAKKPAKVYLPAYCCDSLIQPLISEKIDYEFYSISEFFEPVKLPNLKDREYYLYINYFGLKKDFINKLYSIYAENLIVDSTQGFFEMPLPRVDTFYSARKFFGVPDGGYLYTSEESLGSLEIDLSFDRMKHLLGRYELSASEFHDEYRKSESSLADQNIKTMSKLTQGLMTTFDYKKIAHIRKENFSYLHEKLKAFNLLNIEIDNSITPMVYPFIIDIEIKKELIDNNIYVATYWQDAAKRVSNNSQEKIFIDYLVPLPIDQRYDANDMKKITNVIENFINQT